MLIRSPDDLVTWRDTWRSYHAVIALAETGVLAALSDGEAHPIEAITQALALDARGLTGCLRVLGAAGLVHLDGGCIRLSRVGLACRERLQTADADAAPYAHLAKVVRTGEPFAVTVGGVEADVPTQTRAFLWGMRARAEREAPDAVELVRALCAGIDAPSILDLGGGHGAYASAFAQALPHARITLFDQPAVIAQVPHLSAEGVALRAGDLHTTDVSREALGSFDVVFLSNVLHGEGMAAAGALFASLRAMCGGGALVIKDQLLDATGCHPADAATAGLRMLLHTRDGRAWSRTELGTLLAAARFVEFEDLERPSDGYGYLVAR